MTEKEAIQALRLEGGIEISGNMRRITEFFEGLDTAIKALEEIQHYREIGTVEEIKDLLAVISEAEEDVDESGISVGFIKNIIQLAKYKKIGTVEECRAATYKMKPEKPIVAKDKYSDAYVCPCCGYILIHKDETGWFCGRNYKSCPECAKKIDWSKEE